jgi:triosephosphate isomerase
MNTTQADAFTIAQGVLNGAEHLEKIETVLCPPTIWLAELAHEFIPPRRLPHLKLGAQNMHWEESGAFTGETSPLMIKEVAEYVIVGHSERTHIFREDRDDVALKLKSALEHGLIPILCIGEDAQSETSKRHLVHLLNHLLSEIPAGQIEKIVLAYEPVWAIGSGNPATPEYAQEILQALRGALTEKNRLLYGGSVSAENAKGFLQQDDCDGLLIGGASLKLKTFLTICQYADDLC